MCIQNMTGGRDGFVPFVGIDEYSSAWRHAMGYDKLK